MSLDLSSFIYIGFSTQNLPGRQPIRTVDQRQQDNNPLGQQTITTEQRKSLGVFIYDNFRF